MSFCRFLPSDSSPSPYWECSHCGFRTHKRLAKAPSRECLGKKNLPLEESPSLAYLKCPHRDDRRPLSSVSGSEAGCGCASSSVDVLWCDLFQEPVLKLGSNRQIHVEKVQRRVPDYLGRICRDCKSPMTKTERKRLDILHITHRWEWQDQVRRTGFALGGGMEVEEMPKPSLQDLSAKIEETLPPLVIFHAFPMHLDDMLLAVKRFPHTTFVHVDHSSLNHTFTWSHYLSTQANLLERSRSSKNLFISSVDRFSFWKELGYDHYFYWENPLFVPEQRDSSPPSPPSLMISSRIDWMKALPSQITAAALLQRRREVDCLISWKWFGSDDRSRNLLAHASACGLRFRFLPFGDRDEWYRRLKEEVSILLQPSMSDSFNIMSVESMMFGRPFVGSPCIAHTPEEWRVTDSNDPYQISVVAERILDRYDYHSESARRIAVELVERKNSRFREIIFSLMRRQVPT